MHKRLVTETASLGNAREVVRRLNKIKAASLVALELVA